MSGLELIGPVPNHWSVKPLRILGRLLKGTGGSKEDVVQEGVPCVRYGELYTTHRNFVERARTFVTPERAKEYTPIEYGDVLFAASGETIEDIGKSAVNLLHGAVCGGDVVILRPSMQFVPRFLGYATDAAPVAAQKSLGGRGSTVMHVYPDELREVLIPVPPLAEQQLISDYLDRETARLDAMVVAKQRVLDLLAEKQKAIIATAVTRGLDPNVTLRDSRVPWLGEIPEHWEVWRSKRLFHHRNERADLGSTPLTASQDYGVIPQSEFMEREGRRVVQVETGADILKKVLENDFVISMRSFQGGIESSRHSGAVSSAYVVLIPSAKVFVPFFVLLFKSTSYIQALRSTSSLVRDGQALRYENFSLIDLPLPPHEEQIRIAEIVERQTATLRALAEATGRTIALLKERRSALITAAVTGQLHVGAAA